MVGILISISVYSLTQDFKMELKFGYIISREFHQ